VLFALERNGLVERRRNWGARVVEFTADDGEEIYDIRKAPGTRYGCGSGCTREPLGQ